MSTTKEPGTINIPLSVLVLEDQPAVAESICHQLTEGLKQHEFEDATSGFLEMPKLVLKPKIEVTNNLAVASSVYHGGKLDLFIADFNVKENASSKKATADALSLLKEIKNAGALTPIIGHSAFQELYTLAVNQEIVDYSFHKEDYDSADRVVAKGISVGEELGAYKLEIFNVLCLLKCAAATDSPIDKQMILKAARERLVKLTLPKTYPRDYRRTLTTLQGLILRVSSVKSSTLSIGDFSFEFVEEVEPLLRQLATPQFNFDRDAKARFMKLEALGYEVILRVNV